MAKLAEIDKNGHIVHQFEAHASKVRLCQQRWLSKAIKGDCVCYRKPDVGPGMLPDFLDSEVSIPLWPQEVMPDSNGSARLKPSHKEEQPYVKRPDEALRLESSID